MLTPASEVKQPLVVIVDDVPEDRMMVRRYLTRDIKPGYRTVEASGIERALELVAQELPDCVLLDFNLIGGDGMDLLRLLVSAHGNHAFGLVMLTGSGEASIAVEAMKAGAHDYVEKNGLMPRTLRRTVANAIEKAAIQRELAQQRQQLAQKNDELAAHVQSLQREASERIRAETLAREAAAQIRAVTDHLPINIAQFDRTYRYRFANQFFASRFGLTPEQLLGKTNAEVVGPEIFATYRDRMDQALAGEHVHFETSVKSEQGDRWFSISYVPERDVRNDVIGFVALSTDITERRQSEVALAQARDQAVAATQSRDRFLAALSHELRTPLNPVLLMASEAAENPALPEEVRADFAAIRNNVELEARLIDDLLDLSRISHGKLTLDRRPLELQAVLRNALKIVDADVTQKQIKLQLQLDAAELWVEADEVRLQQIFWNVLKNAVKFTPTGGIVTIASHAEPARGKAVVRISDTGIGLSAEELARIFEAFSQGDHAGGSGSHRFGGLGLGLAITRMLMEAHGGKIVAESAGANQGATFVLELPIGVARVNGAKTEITLPKIAPISAKDFSNTAATGPQQILLVEDHASTRANLALLLQRRGFVVRTAASVKEAQAVAAEHDCALVISDIGLPDGDGYSCILELKKIRPAILAIALSGYGMEEDRRRSHDAGFTDHLTKPVSIQALDRAITRIFDRPASEQVKV